ncbi:hypothetical protein [Streptomyces sp. NPDC093261]|uniref:hypothetical protein n=1 Tax=Streptomyces sp. NPDC093261 TaxID=3366037 RepID=UPI0037FFA83A
MARSAITCPMASRISRIQQINQALDCSLEMKTRQLINELLNGSGTAVGKAL